MEYYWKLNPKQFRKHVKVWQEKTNEDIKKQDLLNFMLGDYIRIAFHAPGDYPSKSKLSDSSYMDPMSDEEMEKQARKNTIKMGGVINDS